ncbi:MAG: hypothetical protein JWR72_944 [Flavisolibacter sp.]|nr:hypothetical protein [Flavisolibacter sp.]
MAGKSWQRRSGADLRSFFKEKENEKQKFSVANFFLCI